MFVCSESGPTLSKTVGALRSCGKKPAAADVGVADEDGGQKRSKGAGQWWAKHYKELPEDHHYLKVDQICI